MKSLLCFCKDSKFPCCICLRCQVTGDCLHGDQIATDFAFAIKLLKMLSLFQIPSRKINPSLLIKKTASHGQKVQVMDYSIDLVFTKALQSIPL